MPDNPDTPVGDKPFWSAKQSDQNRIQTEGFGRIYANNFGIGINNWDASLVFGEIIGEHEGQTVIEEKVKVTVPLSLLKAMVQLLALNLAAFEKKFGEIVIPNLAEFQSPSASASSSPSASVSPSLSASPSPEPPEDES